MLSEVNNFFFKSKIRKRIGFSKKSIYCTSKGARRRYFTKQALLNVMSFLINKCFFNIGYTVFKTLFLIHWYIMGIHPALFWANLFLYFLESKFKKQLISNGCSKAYIYIMGYIMGYI